MDITKKISTYGMRASAGIAIERAQRRILGPYYRRKHKSATPHTPPNSEQLLKIEHQLENIGITVRPLDICPEEFRLFKKSFPFPKPYYRPGDPLREEKLLEHFIAYKLCDLPDAISRNNTESPDTNCQYVDVAGGGTPWAQMLRQKGLNAFAIDLNIIPAYKNVDYYRRMDAKATNFTDSSVSAMSLQCAYEMFMGDDDVLFIDECARILKEGGTVAIVPLYMNTTYGGFSSPDHYGKGHADDGAQEWIRQDLWGIPFAREYDPKKLKERVIDRAQRQGLHCVMYALRNKKAFGNGIYCYFVLALTKPVPAKGTTNA